MNAELPPDVRGRPTAQWTLDSLRFAVEVGYGIRIRASDVHVLAELFAEHDALKARVDLLTTALTDAPTP